MGKRILSLWLRPKKEESQSKSSEGEGHERLLALAGQLSFFSPIVALDVLPDDAAKSEMRELYLGCNLDITGCEKLFDGEVNLLRTLCRKIESADTFHLAAAPSVGSAWAFSRFGKNRLTIISKQKLRDSLMTLPVAALRLDPKTLASLDEVNITHIEQLMKLTRSSLLSRFGPTVLKRIDQAFGIEEEPLLPMTFPGTLRAEKIFLTPLISLEGLQASGHKLLGLLLEKLEHAHKKAAHLMLEVKTVQAPLQIKEIILSVPTTDKKHFSFLLSAQLEKLNMGLGIESLALSIFKTEDAAGVTENYLPHHNEALASKKHVGNLLDILGEHLGEEKITTLVCNESHIPERSFSFQPLSVLSRKKTSDGLKMNEDVCRERPSVLFHIPSPAQVIAALPDSPPSWLKWRDRRYRIKIGLGPERIAPEWWGNDPDLFRTRDYFKIQLQSGTWLWIFRELETQRWFIHGIWC
ncbi:MAG: hypothetical protein U0136_06745 [Bdellovibrionota bacterium]